MQKFLRLRSFTGLGSLIGSTTRGIKAEITKFSTDSMGALMKKKEGVNKKANGLPSFMGLDWMPVSIYSNHLKEAALMLAGRRQKEEDAMEFIEDILGKSSKPVTELCNLSTNLYMKQMITSESFIKRLEPLFDEKKAYSICPNSILQCMELPRELKDSVCITREENLLTNQVKAALLATECKATGAKKHSDWPELTKLKNNQVTRTQQDTEHKEAMLWDYHKENLEIKPLRQRHEVGEGITTNRSKTRSSATFPEPNHLRFLHTTAGKVIKKRKKIPGNTARIVFDTDDLCASRWSYSRGIKKVQAWCRANGISYDLSDYHGAGSEVYTTPPKGTFHLTFVIKRRKLSDIKMRELTVFINARDLYFKGWEGRNGMFETQEKDQKYDYIRDQPCTILETGENYHHLVDRGKIENVRVGPFPMVEAIEILDKCEGLISDDLQAAIAVIAVNICEPIRLQDLKEEVEQSFANYHISTLDSRERNLKLQVRSYTHYSRELLKCVDHLLRGQPAPEIVTRRGLEYKSLHELLRKISVPKIDSYKKGLFVQEPPEIPVWYPPYPDVNGDDDTDSDEDLELDEDEEEVEVEEEEEEVEEEDTNSRVTYHYEAMNNNLHFGTNATSVGMSCIGQVGFLAAATYGNAIRPNGPFSTAWGVKQGWEDESIFSSPQGLSRCRNWFRSRRFLNWG